MSCSKAASGRSLDLPAPSAPKPHAARPYRLYRPQLRQLHQRRPHAAMRPGQGFGKSGPTAPADAKFGQLVGPLKRLKISLIEHNRGCQHRCRRSNCSLQSYTRLLRHMPRFGTHFSCTAAMQPPSCASLHPCGGLAEQKQTKSGRFVRTRSTFSALRSLQRTSTTCAASEPLPLCPVPLPHLDPWTA